MNHVDFGYSSDVPVLRDVSLSIAKPGLYGFVGQNGCGKSTLVKLLLRFYDYDAGSIRYNDIDMMDLSMAEIRRNYTYIAKEPFILKDTLLNNILLADARQLPEEVKRACERAGLAAYVGSLPEGYDTVLNEGGSSLSSGQKQKINMARMMIKKTPVYILDEVTSDLDGVAEKEIMGIIREVAQSAIVLFITHRAAPLMECDRIYVMSEGHIVADGTHAELLERNELYREMFARKQSKEDDDEPQT
ncbi:MAG: ABC transporter ATP-binding protein [Clostridia bacterium]|nr:ABC transporter ATP-binding protein [Clostridia bacterium]